jgi:hypothetical protein
MSSGPAQGSSTGGEIEPDLHLIKQVEQVARLALEARPRLFAGLSQREDHERGRGPRISDSAITQLAVVWL